MTPREQRAQRTLSVMRGFMALHRPKPPASVCPRCGVPFNPEQFQIVECPRCEVKGSTFCCNPSGAQCICAACMEKGVE